MPNIGHLHQSNVHVVVQMFSLIKNFQIETSLLFTHTCWKNVYVGKHLKMEFENKNNMVSVCNEPMLLLVQHLPFLLSLQKSHVLASLFCCLYHLLDPTCPQEVLEIV